MKLVKCVVRPQALDDVKKELTALGITGMTVMEVRGYGKQKGKTEHYRGAEYDVSFVPKVQIECALDDGLVEKAIEAISKVTRTGQIGDGKIFIYNMADTVRIRTGERGVVAL